ncbi:MAG: hypothetical protein ACFB0E_03080 [Leptolyngbyaceae cyanobacterium]
MVTTQYFLPSLAPEAALSALPANDAQPRQHKRLRLYLVGSAADTQQTIHYLHTGGRIERIHWSRMIAVPENGILIRRDPGDVLRYLQRDRQFE